MFIECFELLIEVYWKSWLQTNSLSHLLACAYGNMFSFTSFIYLVITCFHSPFQAGVPNLAYVETVDDEKVCVFLQTLVFEHI